MKATLERLSLCIRQTLGTILQRLKPPPSCVTCSSEGRTSLNLLPLPRKLQLDTLKVIPFVLVTTPGLVWWVTSLCVRLLRLWALLKGSAVPVLVRIPSARLDGVPFPGRKRFLKGMCVLRVRVAFLLNGKLFSVKVVLAMGRSARTRCSAATA